MPSVPELTPTEYRTLWPADAERTAVTLLDVREPDEVAIAAVEHALRIPMREVPARLAELDPSKPLVVMCHGGGRSRRVAEYLAQNGFGNVFNLTGGIDAWSREIDPSIPRY